MSIGGGGLYYKYPYLLTPLSPLIFEKAVYVSFEHKECFSLVLDG